MKFIVDEEACVGCGACEDTCPEVFQVDDDGKAHVIMGTVTNELEKKAIEAENSCPVMAITHE